MQRNIILCKQELDLIIYVIFNIKYCVAGFKDDLPKHFDWFVARSMKTFAEMTVPNGAKIFAKSASVMSCGK